MSVGRGRGTNHITYHTRLSGWGGLGGVHPRHQRKSRTGVADGSNSEFDLTVQRPCSSPRLPVSFLILTPLGSATLHETRVGEDECGSLHHLWDLHHPRHARRRRPLKILHSREHPVSLKGSHEHRKEKADRARSMTRDREIQVCSHPLSFENREGCFRLLVSWVLMIYILCSINRMIMETDPKTTAP